MQATSRARDIDTYIAGFSPEVQAILSRVRATIRAAAPEATEAIKYGIPTFVLHGNLVHFAAFTRHVGLYPGPSGIEHFAADLSKYTSSKGAVQFPLDRPVPRALIARIVRFRVRETMAQQSVRAARPPRRAASAAAPRAGAASVPEPIRAYLAALPPPQRRALETLRAIILSVAPGMAERLSSGAPFVWHRGKRAVGFGAAKQHLSFFIMHGNVLRTHRDALAAHDVSRTVVRFAPDKPLPAALVRTLVRARLVEIERARASVSR
jgi:uncharacterized protein YdhG (YjbR/CyaY superfamily)